MIKLISCAIWVFSSGIEQFELQYPQWPLSWIPFSSIWNNNDNDVSKLFSKKTSSFEKKSPHTFGFTNNNLKNSMDLLRLVTTPIVFFYLVHYWQLCLTNFCKFNTHIGHYIQHTQQTKHQNLTFVEHQNLPFFIYFEVQPL